LVDTGSATIWKNGLIILTLDFANNEFITNHKIKIKLDRFVFRAEI
jgi:hypothetical protein